MEACGGAHFWAREMKAIGHSVKLLSPRYVNMYTSFTLQPIFEGEDEAAAQEYEYGSSGDCVCRFGISLRPTFSKWHAG
jgi:hypothetical protein